MIKITKSSKNKTPKSDFEKSAIEHYIESFDGSKLRVLTFNNPKNKSSDFEVMFIPGLLTIFPRWEKVVRELNETYIVHYIESREKMTSKLVRRASMDIAIMRKDLDYIEKALDLDKAKYITISSSMGGAMVLENLAVKGISPKGSVLVSPAVELHFPWFVRPLLRILPPLVLRMLKPYIRWHLQNKTVDAEKEPQQLAEYTRSVNEADFRKMRRCLLRNANRYNGWSVLPKVNDKIILVGASSDKAHKSDFSAKVSEALKNCKYIDLGTNKAAHDTPLVQLAKDFISDLET